MKKRKYIKISDWIDGFYLKNSKIHISKHKTTDSFNIQKHSKRKSNFADAGLVLTREESIATIIYMMKALYMPNPDTTHDDVMDAFLDDVERISKIYNEPKI